MLKLGVLVLLIVVFGVTGFLLGRLLGPPREPARTSVHTGPTIEQLQMLSALVTLKVDVADVMETSIRGYVGGVRAMLVVKGDFLLSVDLSAAKFQELDPAGKSAVLVLPQPRVLSPRLDHNRSRVFAVTTEGLWLIVPSNRGETAVVNRALADGQQFVMAAAAEPSLAEKSRRHAEQVIGTFFGATGWTVSIRWTA